MKLTRSKALLAFKQFNRKAFGNKLPAIKIFALDKVQKDWGISKDVLAFFEHPEWHEDLKPRIVLLRKRIEIGDNNYWEYNLLHEMVHYYLFLKYMKYQKWERITPAKRFDLYQNLDKAQHTAEFYNILNRKWRIINRPRR